MFASEIRQKMMLRKKSSQPKTILNPAPKGSQNALKVPELEDFLKNRDWSGAMGLLQFQKAVAINENRSASDVNRCLSWIVYCAFHAGEYVKAMEALHERRRCNLHDSDSDLNLHIACCLFYLGQYPEARELAEHSDSSPLRTRLLFHCAHRLNEEDRLVEFHKQLDNAQEDHLCLAAIHFLRGHHQEAVDLYKKMLLESRDMLALNVYVALCYYKLDYYDVSLEILETYLKKYPDSPVALNLKACNHFKLYNGKAAEAELKPLADREGVTLNQLDSDLVRHNLVVFRSGENALQLLPPLLDAVPEAKLNLIIYYLRTGECEEALKLVQSVEPNAPEEYILKGMVLASVGQQTGNKEYLTAAQRNFQLVGSSPSHCDTIPGRQCMAMFFFLVGNFDDVLIYLKSIKAYMQNSLEFTYNYCIVSAFLYRAKCARPTFF